MTTTPLKTAAACAALLLLCWPALACRRQAGPGPNGRPAAERAKDAPTAPTQAGAEAEGAPAPAQNPADPFASVPRMKVEEAAEALKAGRALLLDVRPAEAFEEERIKGAVSLPEEDVVERGGRLPKDKLVIAYCA